MAALLGGMVVRVRRRLTGIVPFLGPSMMNMLFMLMLFAVVYGAGQRGGTDGEQAVLRIAFQACYLLTSLTLGPRLNPRNARRVLLVASTASGLLAAVCLQLTSQLLLTVLLAVAGVCSALYFNGFQAYMRTHHADPTPLSITVSRYHLGWSSGCVVGTLIAGAAYAAGHLALGALCLAFAGVALALLWTKRPADGAADHHAAPEPAWRLAHGPPRAVAGYVAVGWLLIVAGVAVQHPQQALIPGAWAHHGVDPWRTSAPLFMQFLLQSIVGFGLGWFPGVLYRRRVLVLANCAAVLLLLWLSLQTSYWPSASGLALLGVWLGFAYFASVYYVNDSPRRSFNVGVNECLVGLSSVVFTAVAGRWFGPSEHPVAFYRVAAVVLFALTLVQWGLSGAPTAPRSRPPTRRKAATWPARRDISAP